jgi:hypothetical protein
LLKAYKLGAPEAVFEEIVARARRQLAETANQL